MSYSDNGVAELTRALPEVLQQLEDATEKAIQQGALAANERAREYLRSGVGRRLRVLHRTLSNMFELFPPSTMRPLEQQALDDAQINLHAFLMNLYGLLDNLAWVFVLHHDLLGQVGGHKKVGFFLLNTKRFFPPALRAYADDDRLNRWHGEYLKGFRDALAHRIAPYIPPFELCPEDESQYAALDDQVMESMRARDWTRLEDVSRKRASLERPSFVFAHSFDLAERTRFPYLHPQLMSDAATAIELCENFFSNWQQRAELAGESGPAQGAARQGTTFR